MSDVAIIFVTLWPNCWFISLWAPRPLDSELWAVSQLRTIFTLFTQTWTSLKYKLLPTSNCSIRILLAVGDACWKLISYGILRYFINNLLLVVVISISILFSVIDLTLLRW